ncbi:MAG: class I tRNA ligase family protein, partial [Planctomycetota bacterium]
FTKETVRPRSVLERFVLLIAPYAPHLAEELWEVLGHRDTLAYETWPAVNEEYLRDESVEVPVQISGKVRAKVNVPTDCSTSDLEAAAWAEPRIAELLADKQIVKVVVVPGRLVNFVVRG